MTLTVTVIPEYVDKSGDTQQLSTLAGNVTPDNGAVGQGRQAIGRSRSLTPACPERGLTTKLHAIVLEDRLPQIVTPTPGHWRGPPWGRWLPKRLSTLSAQPQLLADHANEGDEMRALAAELGAATRSNATSAASNACEVSPIAATNSPTSN